MHLKRILSAIVAIPLLYLLIAKGGPFWFAVLVAVAGLLAMSEYHFIVLNKVKISPFSPVPLIGYVMCQAIVFTALRYPGRFDLILGLVAFNFILAAAIALFNYSKDPQVLDIVSKQIQGVIYIPVLISTLVMVRSDIASGVGWIFYILVLVALCDTGAFYAGTFFGKNKLCPSVSPGKTIEGFFGGMAVTFIGGLVIRHFFFPNLPLSMTGIFLIVLSIVGPIGDLFESALKRSGGVKDSGAIIPGHGGILDRIDALLFVAPVAYVFKMYLLI